MLSKIFPPAKFARFTPFAMAIAFALATAGCGGGGGGESSSNGGGAPTFRAEAGVAQKGPLITGSMVTVQELDAALTPTGRQYSYQITSDLGEFSPSSTFATAYLGVNATGYYFDEVLGTVSAGPVTLSSYNDLGTDDTLNVNLLTTLAYRRVEHLLKNSNLTFAAARDQAESEVLQALNVPAGNYGAFGTLDLKGNSDGDHLLAAISSLFVYGNNAGDLSALINSFQSDLGADGTLNDATIRAALAAGASGLNTSAIAANLTQRYAPFGVVFNAADLAPWIDDDGDGLVGKFEFEVEDATPATQFTLPAALVSSWVGKAIAVLDGQLFINNTPVTGPALVNTGDSVAISPGAGAFPGGVMNVYVLSQNTRVARVSFVSGLLSITLSPAGSGVAKGLSEQFTATGTFSDMSTADLTTRVTWSSSDTAVATINSSGLARSLALGSTTITAAAGSLAGSEILTVTAAELQAFTVTPSSVRSGVGLTAQLTATGTYSDASTANVTQLATWTSHDPTIATVNAQTGLATGFALGNTTIEASIGSLNQSAPIAIITNEWSAGASAPSTFAWHTATQLPNGKVIAIGGLHGSGASSSVAGYDPATQSWTTGLSLSTARYGHTATLLPNGRILITGGAGAFPPMNDASLYDPTTDHWVGAPSMSGSRLSHTATLLLNGRVLVAGGRELSGPQASAELYDATTNSWSAAGGLTVARSDHTATLLANGKVLVTGGLIQGGETTTAEIYDPVTNAWTSAGSMTAARERHTATLLGDGKVLIAGGVSQGGVPAIAETYDPVANTWTPAGSLVTPRFAHTATLLANGKVLIAGGHASAGNHSEFYDPATNTWSAGPTLVSTRIQHSATLLPNNVVLVIGGRDGFNTLLSSTELYW
jgi:hypothetical protein